MSSAEMNSSMDIRSYREDVIFFFSRLGAVIVLMWLLLGVVFGITPMKNEDMEPQIHAGDLLIYYRLEQDFRVQDVIVFEKDGIQYTGRIVAREGDSVEITDHAELSVNGSVVQENNIYFTTPRYDDQIVYPAELEDDQFFVLCDYREGARDSRYFGAVDKDEIRGKVITAIRRSNL